MRTLQVSSDLTHITVKDRLPADFKGSRHNDGTVWIGKPLDII